MRRLLVSAGSVSLVLVLTFLGLIGSAAAQEATEVAGEAPAPEECLVEPFDLLPILEEIAATPVVEEATTPTVDAVPTRPTGEPADEETVAAVTSTIREFVACANAGYDLRIVFLFSERFLRATLTEGANLSGASPDELASVAQLALEEEADPLPPDQQTVILAIEDVEVLADGRVVATVIGDDLSNPGPPSPVYLIFIEENSRYLIDEIIDPVPGEGGATPVA